MKVYLASDHAGFELKELLIPFVRDLGHEVEDCGPQVFDPADDYPLLIAPCARKVAGDPANSTGAVAGALGIIIGSSGQGEAMVANREAGIRAAVFYGPSHSSGAIDAEGDRPADEFEIVRVARRHNDANILSLGARFLQTEDAKQAVKLFLSTQFSEIERHARRISEF